MMAPMKSLCLLLVLISSSAWLSLAHSSQDTKASGTEVKAVSSAKGLLEADHETAATTYTNKKIKGRKMAMGNHIVNQDQKKERGEVAVAGTTSNISSSNQVGGKYEGEKGKNGSSVERKQNVYRSSEQIDEEAAGFVAFNADYREPRHHPPKNN